MTENAKEKKRAASLAILSGSEVDMTVGGRQRSEREWICSRIL
jgi:hypothetical protein